MLSPEERGPWTEGRQCCRGTPPVLGYGEDTRHPAEPPYFFHCRSCLTAIQRLEPPPKPNEAMDQGLSATCRKPAAPITDVIRADAPAAQQAEARGITVARLGSRRFCADCDPYTSRPYCRARTCKMAGKGRHKGLHRGCCFMTPVGGSFAHCAEACNWQKERYRAASKKRYSKRKTKVVPCCRAQSCIRLGKEPHPGRNNCCYPARKTPHCPEACARRKQYKRSWDAAHR